LPDAVFVLNRDWTISRANARSAELFGYERDELVAALSEVPHHAPQRCRDIGPIQIQAAAPITGTIGRRACASTMGRRVGRLGEAIERSGFGKITWGY